MSDDVGYQCRIAGGREVWHEDVNVESSHHVVRAGKNAIPVFLWPLYDQHGSHTVVHTGSRRKILWCVNGGCVVLAVFHLMGCDATRAWRSTETPQSLYFVRGGVVISIPAGPFRPLAARLFWYKKNNGVLSFDSLRLRVKCRVACFAVSLT